MNDRLTDGMRTAGDWLLAQILDHGLLPVLALTTVVLLATWCGTGTAIYAADRWHGRQQRVPAAPDNYVGTDPELLADCRHIWAASFNPTQPRRETP